MAQAWPARPVRVINAFAPGGPNDIVARGLAQKLSEQTAQQFAQAVVAIDVAAVARRVLRDEAQFRRAAFEQLFRLDIALPGRLQQPLEIRAEVVLIGDQARG